MEDNLSIVFVEGHEELLDLLKPLWKELNKIHMTKSRYFKKQYENKSFEARKKQLLKKKSLIRIDLVKKSESDIFVGYCISSINKDKEGMVESIYVNEGYRNRGIGDQLMERHLEWMDKNRVKVKNITILVGNEDVLNFYRKYNFYPKLVMLEQIL
ncbi:MAG: hypothetical protein QG670_2738 [Thermoproteota archaeon]|nr:hypothetical protein [Thermoproteota archaeon]